MRSAPGLWLVLTVITWAPSPAGAQEESVGVLPPILERGLDPSIARRVATTVENALRSEGVDVVPSRDIAHIAKDYQCDENPRTCALYVRSDLGADYVVLVTVVSEHLDGVPTGVNLAILYDHALQYRGSARVTDSIPENAARQALEEALRKQRRGPGPWLVVDGSPVGARVIVDGQPLGEVPLQAQVSGGSHQVEIRAAGYAPVTKRVRLPSEVDGEHELTVELAAATIARAGVAGSSSPGAAPAPGPVDAGPAQRGSAWNGIIGTALLAGGIALAVDPVHVALGPEACRGTPCGFGTTQAAASLGAVALLAAGASFFALQPIRVDLQAGRDYAGLHVRGTL